LGRPWGHRGPTPEQVWQTRQPITSVQRSQLNTTFDRYREEERTRRGIPDEAHLGGAAQASVDRVAISRALSKHGYLSVMRRLVTHPLNTGARQDFRVGHKIHLAPSAINKTSFAPWISSSRR
jgi:hypothetical protein